MKTIKVILIFLFFIFLNIITQAQVKKVLLEEMSTTLCSFCPYKSIDLTRFEEAHPNAIAVTHHAGFGTDKMTNPAASAFATAFSPFHFPSMTIDRIKYDSVPGYYTKYVGVSMMAFKWEDSSLSVLNNVTPKATVSITKNFNETTREISGTIGVNFISKPDSGDLRINLYIVEDSVIGDTAKYDYDQKNNHTNDANYPELMGKTLIRYYPHRNVVRAAPLGNWGLAGTIPSKPSAGSNYSTPFTYILPVKYDSLKGRYVSPNRIKLVAFVSYYDINTWKRRVLNAEEVILTNKVTSLQENEVSAKANIYPNPANEYTNIDFQITENGSLHVELFDLSGKKIRSFYSGFTTKGSYSLKINCIDIERGNYILKLQTENLQLVKKLMIVR